MRIDGIRRAATAAAVVVAFAGIASARPGAVQTYGDQDVLGTGSYESDPTEGATLCGLAPGVVTYATLITEHPFPFDPTDSDFPGTDQIFAGAFNYSAGDGYSGYGGRINGIQVIEINYSELVPEGQFVESLTLGIAADDFQFGVFGNEFTAVVNGQVDQTLSATLNGLQQTGPVVQFFTIGIGNIREDNTLTLQIRQAAGTPPRVVGGQTAVGDGWAIDFLTIGVTTIPTPGSLALTGLAGLCMVRRRR